MFCASSACGVSSVHLNYKAHPMMRSVYGFHVYYHHVRRILKKLQVPLPHETGFNVADNPYTESEFFKICEDYGVTNDPMKYWWFAYDVIKNMTMQIMINLPQILV